MNNELSKQNLENISGSISCIPITSKSVDSDLDNFLFRSNNPHKKRLEEFPMVIRSYCYEM